MDLFNVSLHQGHGSTIISTRDLLTTDNQQEKTSLIDNYGLWIKLSKINSRFSSSLLLLLFSFGFNNNH